MSGTISLFKWAVLAMLCSSVTACVGANTIPAQFYMLNPVPATEAHRSDTVDRPTVRVSLEPVEIPGYLNRPQIVTQMDGVEYHLEEFHQWLAPLGDNLTRVFAENLAEMLGADGIDVFIMARSVATDFRVAVQILRLDGKPGRNVVLVARWSLFDQNNKGLLLTRRSVIQEALDEDSYGSFVTAENRTIESLSREIGDSIRLAVQRREGS